MVEGNGGEYIEVMAIQYSSEVASFSFYKQVRTERKNNIV